MGNCLPLNTQNDLIKVPMETKKRNISGSALDTCLCVASQFRKVWNSLGCCIETRLYRSHFRWTWGKNQQKVLLRHVTDAGAVVSDLQHCRWSDCLSSSNSVHQRTALVKCAGDQVDLSSNETLVMFINPDMWPTNSSYLNPVDYSIWGVMQQYIYIYVSSINATSWLQWLVETWHECQHVACLKSKLP